MNIPPSSFHPQIGQRTELDLRPQAADAGLQPAGGAADAAAWFLGHGDGGVDAGARITLRGASAGAADVATLAQRVLSHLTG
jgi:hypothetical protein